MKKISIIFIALLSIILIDSCESEKVSSDNFLDFNYKMVKEKEGTCDGEASCGEIYIRYPKFNNNNEAVDKKLNEEITNTITSFYDTKTIDKTAEKFITDYSDFIEDFPDAASSKWDVKMVYKIVSNDDDLLTLMFVMEGYTGGAHGFTNKNFYNYDPATGNKLLLKDVVKNMDKLTIIAQEIFVDKYNLDSKNSLSSQNYNFDNDIFSLNDNFKLDSEGISFHYNHYEIAPYAQGDFDITIPMDKLNGILK